MKVVSAFRRKEPLHFSPKRQYVVAVISPLPRKDSSEPDDRSPETSSPAPSSSRLETTFSVPRERGGSRRARTRQRRATRFQPFSFDERDAELRVERERRLQEMRQKQDQWCFAFKAHPVRRYKPLVQPPTHFMGSSGQPK